MNLLHTRGTLHCAAERMKESKGRFCARLLGLWQGVTRQCANEWRSQVLQRKGARVRTTWHIYVKTAHSPTPHFHTHHIDVATSPGKQRVDGFWKDLRNQRAFVDKLANQLKLDLHNLTADTIRKHGMCQFLPRHHSIISTPSPTTDKFNLWKVGVL
jgi:hypothetical protein